MALDGSEMMLRVVDSFEREHPEYAESLNKGVLRRFLEQVYSEVLRGDHVAGTEARLNAESRSSGIKKPDYEALVNLVAHAAADRPIEK